MNKRTRLVVSLLFVVLIILAAAITRFYLDAENNPAMNVGNESAEKVISVNDEGYSIFSTDKGLYGISESGMLLHPFTSCFFSAKLLVILCPSISIGISRGKSHAYVFCSVVCFDIVGIKMKISCPFAVI